MFPGLKFDYTQRKMKKSNLELVYFMIAALIFFSWSFFAGILLKLEERYIGISLTALSLVVVFVYSSDVSSSIFE